MICRRDLGGLVFAIVILLAPIIIGGAALLQYFGWIN